MADSNQPARKQSQSNSPSSKELNSLSDHQLKKLTRSNTRKNVGGKKNRFLSQLERVCRRLELLNVSPQVERETQNHSLDAIPVVNPDGSKFTSPSENGQQVMRIKQNDEQQEQREESDGVSQLQMPRRAQTPRFNKDTPFATEGKPHNSENSVSPVASTSDDEFDIEPATVDSANVMGSSSTLTTKSFRSVRISTEVTILGYSAQHKRGEPMSLSVSTLRRTEHPTRNGKCFQLQRQANDNRFPRVMNSLERSNRLNQIEKLSRDGGDSTPPSATGTNSLRFAKESPRRPQCRTGSGAGGGVEKPSDAAERNE